MRNPAPPKMNFRPAGRVVVLGTGEVTFETASLPAEANEPLIKFSDYDVVDSPEDLDSLCKILNNNQGSIIPYSSDSGSDQHGFHIQFDLGTDDFYSAARNKLYVARGACCNLKFVTTSPVPPGSQIKVTSAFVDSDQTQYVVHRCVTHAVEDFLEGVNACDHVIRCENNSVSYVRNLLTLQRSLIIPYQPLPGDPACCISSLRFMCLNTCQSINRRPFRVICTLENGGNVLGCRSFEVRVCKAPQRDFRNDEFGKQGSGTKKRKHKECFNSFEEIFQRMLNIAQENSQENEQTVPNAGPFHIIAADAEERDMLLKAKYYFEIVRGIQRLPADVLGLPISRSKKPKKRKNKG